jgi:regulatory protein
MNATEQQKKAYDKAIRLLAIREHSASELKRKLGAFSVTIIEQVLTQLQQQNYQSDERFVQSLVRSRLASGKGYLWIKQELSQHQIDSEMIGEALSEIEDEQWQDYCYQVWQKKFATKNDERTQEQNEEDEEAAPLDYKEKMKQKIKQQSFLSQRGFRSQDWQNFLK